ncbi:MAG: hypothetical protein JSU70_11920 [Phycisphaerales bacterium]|nr:MAG: hypothetical protein JSU70_11920 [Phycisphaerales bacterium]
MKNFVVTLAVLLLASSAWADVAITVVDNGDCTADIMYDAGAGPLVRAFALDITVDVGTIDGISGYIKGESTAADPGFGIFPANFARHITVDAGTGDVADWDIAEYTPVADAADPGALGGLGTAGITIEAGALYSPTDDASTEAPPAAGKLCTIALSEAATVTIAENAIRGGVVLTDATAATVNITGGPVTCGGISCLAGTPDEAEHIAVGLPPCWCDARQCHGNADGAIAGSPKTGQYYVGTGDLNILIAAWLVKEPPQGPGIASVENGICADFARDQAGSPKTGVYRVGTSDLNILVANWLVKEPPQGPGIPADCGP